MTTIDTATTTFELPTDDFVVDDAQLAMLRSWLATAAAPWMHTVG